MKRLLILIILVLGTTISHTHAQSDFGVWDCPEDWETPEGEPDDPNPPRPYRICTMWTQHGILTKTEYLSPWPPDETPEGTSDYTNVSSIGITYIELAAGSNKSNEKIIKHLDEVYNKSEWTKAQKQNAAQKFFDGMIDYIGKKRGKEVTSVSVKQATAIMSYVNQYLSTSFNTEAELVSSYNAIWTAFDEISCSNPLAGEDSWVYSEGWTNNCDEDTLQLFSHPILPECRLTCVSPYTLVECVVVGPCERLDDVVN